MKTAKEFKLVECSGTAYEIGLQWGEGCRESFYHNSENSFRKLELLHQAKKDEVMTKAMRFLPLIKEFDPYLIDIMQGQAAATGLSFAEIVTHRCLLELSVYYPSINSLCTGFAATGEATAGGKTLLGQNIDWAPGATIDFLKVHHNGGPVQYILSFTNASEYTLSNAGFGICGMATIGRNYAYNLPVPCYMPRVMRQKNSYEAMDLLKKAARGFGYFHLANANGFMMGIESTYNDYEVIQPIEDLMVHSNHYLTKRFQGDDMLVYMAELGMISSEMALESLKRYERMQSLMYRDYGRITPQTAMEVLADHENYPLSICRHDDSSPYPSVTQASFIMVPAEGTIYVACEHPCRHEYVRYTF